jgi:hypothetical protein
MEYKYIIIFVKSKKGERIMGKENLPKKTTDSIIMGM